MRRALCVFVLSIGCSYDWSLPNVDAGSDASAFSCAGALFCDTFDETSLIPKWDDTHVSSGGTLRIDNLQDAPTPLGALFAQHLAQDVEPTAAYPEKTFGKLSTATLTFSIRPETQDATSLACVGGVIFTDSGGTDHIARVLVGATAARIEQGSSPATFKPTPMSATVTTGVWSTIEIAVAIGGNVTVKINGAIVGTTPTDASWASVSSRVFVGINFTEAPLGSTVGVHIDDVRVDGT